MPSRNFGYSAKALPLRIEQLTEDVIALVISCMMPSGPLRRITPPEWPSITLAEQLEPPASKVIVIWRAPVLYGRTPTRRLPLKTEAAAALAWTKVAATAAAAVG